MLNKDDLIADLVDSHQATGRVLSPVQRGLITVASLVLAQALLFHSTSPINKEVLQLISSSPRFIIEMMSGFTFTFYLALFFFTKIIPGAVYSKRSLGMLIGSGVLFFMSFLFTFFESTPSYVLSGGRAFCDFQIMGLGLLPLPLFYWMAQKGVYWRDKKTYLAYGISMTMIPALLMQVACKNEPIHAFFFHYLPTLVVGALSIFLFNKIANKLSQ